MLAHELFSNGKTPLFYLGEAADAVLTEVETKAQIAREALPVIEDEPE